jgi:uncharacterized protein (TIGR02231 family)
MENKTLEHLDLGVYYSPKLDISMKITYCYLILFFVCIHASAQQTDEQKLTASLTHATVFLNRAQLTHVAKATLNAGVTQLTIEGLPAGLDRQSLQVSGKGDAVILAVKGQVNHLNAQTKSNAVLRLEDSLQTSRNELSTLQSVKDVLNKEQQMLMANQSIGSQQAGVTVERLQQMADFFRSRLTDIQNRLIKNDLILVKTNERINRLQRQLNELNARRNQPTGEVLVSLSAKSRVPVELEISYLVDGAGWSPMYDLRAKDTRSPVQLNYKAYVQQNTGMDWNKVRLTLSTTNPSQGGTSPMLQPQFLAIAVPRVKGYGYTSAKPKVYSRNKSMEMDRAPGLEVEEAAPAPTAVPETIADYTTVTESAVSVSFDIALPYSVPSGGSAQLVDIQSHELPATYRHFSVPKLDNDAFLQAQVTGWEQYNLLSGMANIYFEGTFVGESFLDAGNTKDTLNLSLGRDKKLVVKREKITEFSSRKFIGRNTVETQAYRITIRNTKKEPIQLTLEDQLPVSQDSQIEVEMGEAKGAVLNKETGKLTWQLSLSPSESRTLDLKYTVKYPKDKEVAGL